MGRTSCTEPQCLYKGALYLFIHKRDCNVYFSKIYVAPLVYETINSVCFKTKEGQRTRVVRLCTFPFSLMKKVHCLRV